MDDEWPQIWQCPCAATQSTMQRMWGLEKVAGPALRSAHCLVGGADNHIMLRADAYRGADHLPIYCTVISGPRGLIGMREGEFVTFFLVLQNRGRGRPSRVPLTTHMILYYLISLSLGFFICKMGTVTSAI